MKKFIPFFLLIHCLSFNLQSPFAQAPAWLDFSQRKLLYPDNEYFIGFGNSRVAKGDTVGKKLRMAESYARQELSESIFVTIQSNSALRTKEEDKKITEAYKQSVVSFSNVNLTGLNHETYFDIKTKTAYALDWISKQKLADVYQNLANMHSGQLESKLTEAGNLVSNGQKQKALDTYNSCYSLVRQMEEDVIMLILIGKNVEGKTPADYESQISQAISGIQQNTNLTLDELCQLLAGSLKKQLGTFTQTIRLVPFTYQDSKMASELSARVLSLLEQKLTDQGLSISTLALPNKVNSVLYQFEWVT